MRNPERIPKLMRRLEAVWAQYPDLRFGQFVLNVAGNRDLNDIWNLEEAEWMSLLSEFQAKHPPSNPSKGT